jgi:hypothetical protein
MNNDSVTRTLRRFSRPRYFLVLEGILVGAAGGLVTVAFRAVLGKGEEVLGAALDFGAAHPAFIPLWFAVLLGAAALVTLLLKWEPLISGSGIPQVEGEMQGHIQSVWWRVLLAKFVGGMLSIGSGLALGREGPSIQLGAMAGKGIARLAKRVKTEEKLLMSCGASAGLAAAFNAPLAGVLFPLEEVHKNFSLDVLLPAMASSITADFLSRNLFGMSPVFDFTGVSMLPLRHYWLVLLLGILLGLFGALYNWCTAKAQDLFDKIRVPYIKTALPFLAAGLLGFVYPAALGGGHGLIGQASSGLAIQALALLLLVRFCFSLFSFGSGAPGGIFLPLLVLGGVSGSLFGTAAQTAGLSLPLANFVILGMAGYFAAVVRAPVTGILLICEMTGSFTHMLSLALVSLAAYAAADLLRAKPIYEQLLHRLLRRQNPGAPDACTGEKLLVETPVHLGAPVCGKRLRDISLPAACLVVSVRRGEAEFIPKGDTELCEGDTLSVLCDEYDSAEVTRILEEQCKSTHFPRP